METVLNNTEVQSLKSDTEDFSKVVEESKMKIHEAGLQETKKRGRGRPPKASSQAPISSSAAQSTSGLSGPTMATNTMPPPDISPYLVDPLIAISKIPAKNYGIEDLALSREEASMCATALNECLKAFVPDLGTMDPKTAAILGLFVTVGSIGFTKYQIYLEKKPRIQAPEPTVQEFAAENQAMNGVAAENYFRRQ